MNTKIIIIGQAPPAVKQIVPYDTTLLYDMLSWVNISKEQAQEMFEFEAMVDFFPGHGDSGHNIPTEVDMLKHYNKVLFDKIQNSKGIIILGKVAEKHLTKFQEQKPWDNKPILSLVHPSKRNYSRIMDNKELITTMLKTFLKK